MDMLGFLRLRAWDATREQEKKKESPERAKNIDKLLGAANIWCWNPDSIVIANRLEEAGIDKILWSAGTSAKQIEELTKRNILVSRYDIYQDVMNPENYDKIAYKHSDWVPEAFPHDITIGPDGNFVDAPSRYLYFLRLAR